MKQTANTAVSLKKSLKSRLVYVAVAAAVLTQGFALGGNADTQASSGKIAWLESSMMPKSTQTIKPAPATWSSRLNVRLEARWGTEGRYMV